ncbi:hypothetical protein glysoja_038334 [Glycine soja]|uniref:Uncharacterized protein n=1 Tax=Glycine soja TaxID=3848 RepID=A0A0B2S4F3_GLYSO|nr:hypothetical protein glysoja_038334 [Glycine soja]
MELAPPPTVVFGSIAFAVFWVLAVFPCVPFLPIGRTAGSPSRCNVYGRIKSSQSRSSFCCN